MHQTIDRRPFSNNNHSRWEFKQYKSIVTLSVQPSKGAGVFHLRSHVTYRDLRPSLSRDIVIVMTERVQ